MASQGRRNFYAMSVSDLTEEIERLHYEIGSTYDPRGRDIGSLRGSLDAIRGRHDRVPECTRAALAEARARVTDLEAALTEIVAERSVDLIQECRDLRSRVTELERSEYEAGRLIGSSIVLATLDTLAGEAPAEEPTHALPCAVMRLVRERDAALADRDALRGRIVARLHEVADVIVGYTGSDPAAKEVAVYAAMRIRSAADEFLPDGALPPDATKKVTCR